MLQQEGLKKLATIIQTDFRHKYYNDNVELYEKYLTLSTGRGWEKFLYRLISRVSLEEFEHIKGVTIDICKSVVKNLTHVFYRVTRSIGIKVEYKTVESGKQQEFEDILKSFGRYGFEGYCEKRFTDFCKIDPNGFVVIDFLPTDGKEYAKPYPVEFYSPDVIDYNYLLNQLQYLAVKQDTAKQTVNGLKAVSDYTIYTQEGAVKFIARPDIETALAYNPSTDYVSGDIVSLKEDIVKDENGNDKTIYEVYELSIPLPYNMEFVPAICSGYLPDEYHRGETYLNFFDNAVPLLEKIINANSESDISMRKHAFPQKVQFVKQCPAKCEPNEKGVFCNDTGGVCQTCQGEGNMEVHRTGMDFVYIPLNDDTSSINIDNIVKYVQIPLDTIKYQWDHIINDLVAFAKRVMYNTEIFSKQEVSDTATAKLIEMENMYDTLYIYAVHYASVKEFFLNTISAITDIDIEVKTTVNKDFKLLGKTELLTLLKLANDAGANSAIIEAIQDEIAYSFFGNSTAYQNYLQRKRLLPFQNKTKEQLMLILAPLEPDNYYKLMFEYGEEILDMLEYLNPDWASFTLEKQQSMIDAELKKIKELIPPPTNPVAPTIKELNTQVA